MFLLFRAKTLKPFRHIVHISTSPALHRRPVVESSDSEASSSDSDDDRALKYASKGDVVWEPRVVEFPSFYAKEEEKYFHELLAFPWQRGRTQRFIQRLEKKYFPKHGLDSMLLPAYRTAAAENKSKENAVAKTEGFPDDRFHTKIDYPTLAKALSTGVTSTENFRSQRSKPSLTSKKSEIDKNSGPSFDWTPSIRTIRAPLNRDGFEGSSPVTDGEKSSGQTSTDKPLDKEADTNATSVAPPGHVDEDSSASQAVFEVNISSYLDVPIKPPVLKRGMELPEKWNVPGGKVVLIDKPSGWTSFDVCGQIRRLVRVKKVGHAGTLDPMATGLLVVCVGQATKLADSYQALSKVYTGTLRLGEATPSCDAESPVNERKPWEHISDRDIQHAKEAFVGDIMQIPPMFSAIKVQGERLYNRARRGEHLDIPARKISVHEFEIERNKDNRQDLDFRICCSKGTYIRSICADLGRALNCCAHLRRLRRDKIGDLSVSDAWEFADLADTYSKLYQKPPLEL